MSQKENRRGEEEECTGGAKICKTVGIKKFIAMSREEERKREREKKKRCRYAGRQTSYSEFELWQHRQFGGRKKHICRSVIAREKRPFLFFTKKKWHLSQVQQGILGFTSPILFLPSPPTISLTASPSCWKRKGGRGEGGGGGPTGHRQHCGSLFLQLLPAYGGQDAIGSAFLCDMVPLT